MLGGVQLQVSLETHASLSDSLDEYLFVPLTWEGIWWSLEKWCLGSEYRDGLGSIRRSKFEAPLVTGPSRATPLSPAVSGDTEITRGGKPSLIIPRENDRYIDIWLNRIFFHFYTKTIKLVASRSYFFEIFFLHFALSILHNFNAEIWTSKFFSVKLLFRTSYSTYI